MLSMVISLILAPHIAEVPQCEALPITPDVACVQTPKGVVVADDRATAERFARVVVDAEARFRRALNQEPRSYAVLVGERVNPMTIEGGTASLEWQSMLQDAGAEIVLPWFTDEQRRRIQMRQREGLPEGQDSAVAHEFGHFWLTKVYWPNQPRGPGSAPEYGTPAPDWFDETVAILMEDDTLTQSRVDAFLAEWKSASGQRPLPLTELFQLTHPRFDPARAGFVVRAEDLPAGARIVARPGAAASSEPAADRRSYTMSRAGAGPATADPAASLFFYSQARMVADFITDVGGDPAWAGQLAQHFAQGRTIDDWLSGDAPATLGDTVAEMDTRYRDWLTRKYGPAA